MLMLNIFRLLSWLNVWPWQPGKSHHHDNYDGCHEWFWVIVVCVYLCAFNGLHVQVYSYWCALYMSAWTVMALMMAATDHMDYCAFCFFFDVFLMRLRFCAALKIASWETPKSAKRTMQQVILPVSGSCESPLIKKPNISIDKNKCPQSCVWLYIGTALLWPK